MARDGSGDGVPYDRGAATLRSSAHRAVYSKSRKGDPGPVAPLGPLPDGLRAIEVFDLAADHDLRPHVVRLLRRAGADIGSWPSSSADLRLEDFVVPAASLRDAKAGTCVDAQANLATLVASDAPFLAAFDRVVDEAVIPRLRRRLLDAGGGDAPRVFHVQRPPTLRLQPGPSSRHVRAHRDAEYGHQDGEINFWIPLTDPDLTGVTLEVETAETTATGPGSFEPAEGARPGRAVAFHGTSRRHRVPANASARTRASLDFRIGVEGYFDPEWTMRGTKADHGRRKVKM